MLYQPGYEKQRKAHAIPMQDYMGLDNSSRMNQPSTVGKELEMEDPQKGADREASERDPWYCASLRDVWTGPINWYVCGGIFRLKRDV